MLAGWKSHRGQRNSVKGVATEISIIGEDAGIVRGSCLSLVSMIDAHFGMPLSRDPGSSGSWTASRMPDDHCMRCATKAALSHPQSTNCDVKVHFSCLTIPLTTLQLGTVDSVFWPVYLIGFDCCRARQQSCMRRFRSSEETNTSSDISRCHLGVPRIACPPSRGV